MQLLHLMQFSHWTYAHEATRPAQDDPHRCPRSGTARSIRKQCKAKLGKDWWR
jgi:hypothetical protein